MATTMNASTPYARQQRPKPTRSSTTRTPSATAQPLSPSAARNAKTPSERLTKPSSSSHGQSPSYFGLTIDSAQDTYGSNEGVNLRQNWSPPTSNVRSTAAASPRVIPLDQNPEFEAFRRQAEQRGGLNFSRPSGSLSGVSIGSRKSSSDSMNITSPGTQSSRQPLLRELSTSSAKAAADEKTQAANQRSPKRLLSSPVPVILDRPRRNSPAGFNDRDETIAKQIAKFADEDRQGDRSVPPSSRASSIGTHVSRAETLPDKFGGDGSSDGSSKEGPAIVTPQHVVGLLEAASEEILLLDLRVSTQYARSRISGALNLCIPTTLLKRASFNVQKLGETFKDPEQQARFDHWRSSRYIIVYDQSTSLMKDAAICVNTLKKFAAEGFKGCSYIIRGGFDEFSAKFPSLVGRDDAGSASPSSANSEGPAVAPVAGGCPMPVTESAANPFFGNIRQNMDLIGGVGQQTVKRPDSLTKEMEQSMPKWLREAADPADDGKRVADKFLAIEQKEQKRMQDAFSGKVQYDVPTDGLRLPSTPLSPTGVRRKPPGGKVQIAGVEKGDKNRYNNIYPFEHSRVKLQGVPSDGCDYVNANHVKAAWSNRRYIATQGPIPATFGVSPNLRIFTVKTDVRRISGT